jgi:enoyl-CoA hydratase
MNMLKDKVVNNLENKVINKSENKMTLDVLCEEITGFQGNIGLITLNRQHALNALNAGMFHAIHFHLKKWENMPTIKAVVIRAAPGRAFSAGGDIRYIYEKKIENDPHLNDFFSFEYNINKCIFHYPKPYIAILDGITMGGGAGISMHGSHRIATKNCIFAMPETTIGFFPDIGSSYFLSRLPHHIGVYLGLSGNKITYQDCYALGLVEAVIDLESQDLLLKTLVETPLTNSISVDNAIDLYRVPVPKSILLNSQEDIEACFSKSSVEEIIEALKIKNTDWSRDVVETLKTKSPTSLKVTLEEITKGKKLDFDACMEMENNIMKNMLLGHDFFEGIRALMIDKDKNPKWQPNTLENVTKEKVNSYF